MAKRDESEIQNPKRNRKYGFGLFKAFVHCISWVWQILQ
jgi:hypothetical protein